LLVQKVLQKGHHQREIPFWLAAQGPSAGAAKSEFHTVRGRQRAHFVI